MACFWIVALLMVVGGLRYMTLTHYLHHHAVAVGKDWEELGEGERVLFLAALRSAGGAFLACGIALIFLLRRPFKNGESWARYAIVIVSTVAVLPLGYSVMTVAMRTPSSPPYPLLILGACLLGVGFVTGRRT